MTVESADFTTVKHMLTALENHAVRLDYGLSVDATRQRRADVDNWLFDFALLVFAQIGRVVSVLFRDWEVGLMKQTIPGTGLSAVEARVPTMSGVRIYEGGSAE